jgi:hypothetical protein
MKATEPLMRLRDEKVIETALTMMNGRYVIKGLLYL